MMNEYLTLCKDYTQFCCNLNPYDIMQEDIPELFQENATALLNNPAAVADEIAEYIDEDCFANDNERSEAIALLAAVKAWAHDIENGVR